MLRLVSMCLAVFAGVGSAVYALAAGDGAPRYRVSVAPAKQSAVPGQQIHYSIGVHRNDGFTGPVSLRVAKLPRGVRAVFRPNGDRAAATVPARATGGTLTVGTSRATPIGFRWLRLRLRGADVTKEHRVGLRVVRPVQGRYRLAVTPARQTVTAGGVATLRVRVERRRGFRGGVRYRLAAVPKDWRRSGRDGQLTMGIPADAPSGAVRVVVAARSGAGRRAIRRYQVVVVQVARRRPFAIDGDVEVPLAPGLRVPLDLLLDNPHAFDIRLTRLRVELPDSTSVPGCSAGANYVVDQYSGSYPVLLAPGVNRLSALVRDRSFWPQVSMRNLPSDQDACKGARLALHYDGTAVQ